MNKQKISVVIPTLEDAPLTLESIPEGVETEVVSEGNRSEARNIGCQRTSGEIIVFCDDDIQFSESFLFQQVELTPLGTVSGLTDFDFGLLLTRFMVVHRSDFERLGGFDENMNHMEDTDFSLNALTSGLSLRRISRDLVYHEEHEKNDNNLQTRVQYSAYLLYKYPRRWPPLLFKMLL